MPKHNRHLPARPLVRLLQVTCALALLAAVTVVVMPGPAHPPERVTVAAAGSAVPYTGPTSDAHRELVAALERARLAAFYEWAAEQEAAKKSATRTRTRRIQPAEGNVGAQATQDGDRFDRLASCESGDGHGSINPQAVSPGGKYRGAFQFSLTSWHSAGMAGDPIDYDYGTQKQTAMRWASITTPSSQWPVCWPRTA